MDTRGVLRIEGGRDRAGGGVVPRVTTAIRTHATSGLLGTFGLAQAIALLDAAEPLRAYLFAVRVAGVAGVPR